MNKRKKGGCSCQNMSSTMLRPFFLTLALFFFYLLFEQRERLIDPETGNRRDFKFKVGEVVRHKLYGFRGVVNSMDSEARFDVSNWDGLRDVETLDQPFYVIIPDEEDCVEAFGQARQWRYVIEEVRSEVPSYPGAKIPQPVLTLRFATR